MKGLTIEKMMAMFGSAQSRQDRPQREENFGMGILTRIYATLALSAFLVVLLVADADARGRTGSFRGH
jgi:hypothetical protein